MFYSSMLNDQTFVSLDNLKLSCNRMLKFQKVNIIEYGSLVTCTRRLDTIPFRKNNI